MSNKSTIIKKEHKIFSYEWHYTHFTVIWQLIVLNNAFATTLRKIFSLKIIINDRNI